MAMKILNNQSEESDAAIRYPLLINLHGLIPTMTSPVARVSMEVLKKMTSIALTG